MVAPVSSMTAGPRNGASTGRRPRSMTGTPSIPSSNQTRRRSMIPPSLPFPAGASATGSGAPAGTMPARRAFTISTGWSSLAWP